MGNLVATTFIAAATSRVCLQEAGAQHSHGVIRAFPATFTLHCCIDMLVTQSVLFHRACVACLQEAEAEDSDKVIEARDNAVIPATCTPHCWVACLVHTQCCFCVSACRKPGVRTGMTS
jgi:hypothetical protein